MMTESMFHIYVNNRLVANNLIEEEFKREMKHIQGFLELTNLDNSAKIEYVECVPTPLKDFEECSY